MKAYGCVKCQRWHIEVSPLWATHRGHQSKDAERDVRPTVYEKDLRADMLTSLHEIAASAYAEGKAQK